MTTILLTGSTGQLGSELVDALQPLGRVVLAGRASMDLADPDSIRAAVRAARPDIIVNAAGYTMVDRAEAESDLAMRINGLAPGIIAEEARRLRALLIHYSTDYVYDGELGRVYVEDDAPNPVNVYGRTKLAGERAIEAVGGAYLILRTSWMYGDRRDNFVLTILRLARERAELNVVADQEGSPSWSRSLALATAELLQRTGPAPGPAGIYHLSTTGHVSRYEFARTIVDMAREIAGAPGPWATVKPIASGQYPLPAARPRNPATSKEKIRRQFGLEMASWEDDLRAWLMTRPGARRPIPAAD